IHRQPIARQLLVEQRALVVRIGEAREVPARIHERIERVGLTRCRAAALRASRVLPRRMAMQRIARLVLIEGHVFRQRYRQALDWRWHDATLSAVDRRNRAAPIALA